MDKEKTIVRSIRFPETAIQEIEEKAKESQKSFNKYLLDAALKKRRKKVK